MGMSFLTAATFSSATLSRRSASLRASFCSVSEMASLPCWEILRRYSSVRAIIMASCRRLTCICQYESWSRSSQSRILFNSMSTPLRAFRASSVKVTSATRKSFRDWIDRTFADWAMGCVLAVAPGLAKAGDLTVEHGQLVHEIVVELLQPRGEPADFLRIHDGLCHAMPLSETKTKP